MAAPTFTDQGSNVLRCSATTVLLRASDTDTVALIQYEIAQQDVTIPANTGRYVGIQYNSGSPNYVVKTADTWDSNTDFRVANVYNEAGTIHISPRLQRSKDLQNWLTHRLQEVEGLQRAEAIGGLILSESADDNKYVVLSAGELYIGLDEFSISAFNTSGADRFDSYYRDAGSSFTKVATQQTWQNTHWDDDSGTLDALLANKYVVNWFYLETDGGIVHVYGRAEHATLTAALTETPPTTVPGRIDLHGILIGAIIVQEGDDTAIVVQPAFSTTYGPASITQHNTLSGLGNDDHAQYQLVLETATIGEHFGLNTSDVCPKGGVGSAQIAVQKSDGFHCGIQFTDADNYPELQIFPFAHDNVQINFDCYHNSVAYYSSDAGSSFQIEKNSDKLQINYDVAAAGAVITWNEAMAITAATGLVTIGPNLQFQVEAGAGNSTLVVDSNSRVGINTAAPLCDLHVKSAIASVYYVGMQMESTGTNAQVLAYWTNDAQTWAWMIDNGDGFRVRDVTAGTTDPFIIQKGAGSSSLVIDSGSKVGINTGSPLELLELYSNTQTTDNYTLLLHNAKNAEATNYDVGIKFKFSSESGAEAQKFCAIMAEPETNYANIQGLGFYTRTNAEGAPARRFRIYGGGNVEVTNGNFRSNMISNYPGYFDRKTDDGGIVAFLQDNSIEGYINISGTTTTLVAFLGSHLTQLKGTPPPLGGVVIATGDIVKGEKPKHGSSDEKVKLKEYFPEVDSTTIPNDKRVYGVYHAETDTKAEDMHFGQNKKSTHLIASVGLWKVRVTDTAGDIENGDLLTTSSRAYEAQKQADDVMHSYTLAKACVDVKWNLVQVDPVLGYKWKMIPATIHAG